MAAFVTKIRTTPAIPLVVTASPAAAAAGISFYSAVTTVQSTDVLIIPAGGVAPYTFSWAYVSGNTGFNCVSPTSASTSWHKEIDPATSEAAVWRCTVTDALSTVATIDVSVNLSNGFVPPFIFNFGF